MSRRLLSRPEPLMVLTFAGLIVVGAVLLKMPVCQGGRPVTTLDALFTATSAVCVTGLTTVSTETGFSRAGQIVILLLIQLGGLGVMTFGVFAVQLFHRRITFGSQAALQDAYFQTQARGDLTAALRQIVVLTLLIEGAGAALLWLGLSRGDHAAGGWFDACFLSVSAFCNAGFSVYDDSLMRVRDAPLVTWTIMALIVLGGIGYTVLLEAGGRAAGRIRGRAASSVRWSLSSRIAIATSAALIAGGALAMLAAGLGPGADDVPASVTQAVFQSVTTRTAGFSTVDFARLPVETLLLMVPLMFIGGSPGSCAGGIKTTSVAVWVARVYARLRGRDDVNLAGRRIPHDVVRRAALVIAVAALWNLGGVMVLTCTEHVGPDAAATASQASARELRFEQIIFEQVSAFATVGLSTGITPDFSPAGKLWLMASMFVGRLGPLTIALAALKQPRARFYYAEERVMIG